MYIPRRLYIFGCVLKPEAVGEGGGGVVSEQKVFRHKSIYKYRDIEQKWWTYGEDCSPRRHQNFLNHST